MNARSRDDHFKIVVMGASAGGVPGLRDIVRGLPGDLNAAVLIVLHLPAGAKTRLHEILNKLSALPAAVARDGEPIEPGRIYVALPDYHLLVQGDRVGVKKGPKENRFRPSIDALFRSAAYTCGSRVIGVVLSGVLSDGISGLWTIKELGGITIVQDPSEAAFDAMPASALAQVEVDHCAPASELGPLIARICAEPTPPQRDAAFDLQHRLETEVAIAASDNAFEQGSMELGERTALTCPECQGSLVRITEGDLIRFRCHTGHAFVSGALLAGISETTESKLWQTLRAMEEAVMLLEHLGQHLQDTGQPVEAGAFQDKAHQMRARARALREIAIGHETITEEAIRASATQLAHEDL